MHLRFPSGHLTQLPTNLGGCFVSSNNGVWAVCYITWSCHPSQGTYSAPPAPHKLLQHLLIPRAGMGLLPCIFLFILHLGNKNTFSAMKAVGCRAGYFMEMGGMGYRDASPCKKLREALLGFREQVRVRCREDVCKLGLDVTGSPKPQHFSLLSLCREMGCLGLPYSHPPSLSDRLPKSFWNSPRKLGREPWAY